jgi:dTDP-4-amino-4,6-dideoxygalactose transaminase
MLPDTLPDLGQPAPIPEAASIAAASLLASGRLHRYGEAGGTGGPVAALEREFAELIGRRYAVAVNSCGSSMFLALIGTGVRPGDPVLMNAFTLGPVPGAIAHAGAVAIPVEITEDLVIDLADLRQKAKSSGAKHLLASHMRGHLCDLEALRNLCAELGITLIEDCAHALGADWAGTPAGAFGRAACFSLQSAKHVNAGEGGVLVTDDPDLAARAILHSGSYMLYEQNGTVPPPEVMNRWRDACANFSLRMTPLVAALALPQLPLLAERVADWNQSHDRIAAALRRHPEFALPERPQGEHYAQSSLQFRLPGRDRAGMQAFLAAARTAGVYVKWFGTEEAEGYTSNPGHWAGVDAASVPRALAIQASLCDIRLPLGLSAEDCDRVAAVLVQAATETAHATP